MSAISPHVVGGQAQRFASTQPPPQRVRTVFFMARISRVSDQGLFVIRNISDQGVKLLAHVRLHVGERLMIALSDNLTVSGSVIWCESFFCGVAFDEPIDSTSFLASLPARNRSYRRSALRLPVMKRATLYSESGIHSVKITDVSCRNLGLAHAGQIQAGMVVRLVLESGATRLGAVSWSKKGHAGVILGEPFTIAELESANSL